MTESRPERTDDWASVHPTTAVVGERGTWTITFHSAGGIAVGGGLRVQLPHSWHAWFRNSAQGPQASDPSAADYVSARSGSTNLICEVEGETREEFVKSNRTGLDSRLHRYAFVVRIRIVGPALPAGGSIDLVVGDRSAGGAGFRAALHPEGPEPITIAVDPVGDGDWRLLAPDASPTLEVRPAEPSELILTLPSTAGTGERVAVHAAVLDRLGNAVTDYTGVLSLTGLSGAVELPAAVSFTSEDRGVVRAEVEVSGPGVVRIRGELSGGLTAVTNPMSCERLPAERLYWGELHSHADDSFDATGLHPFDYGRDVAALDFLALTDHAEGWPVGRWSALQEAVKFHYRSGEFVTLLAYEATFGQPWGHHNVYFRDEDGPVVGDDSGDLLELWRLLEDGRAITIPHHTGVCFAPGTQGEVPGDRCPNPDWQYHDPGKRTLAEIYSGHGLCERYDPDHPLSYENCDFSLNTSREGPYWVWDAWLRGHRLGLVAASDNHRGQPGRGETGLAAVRAGELTRDAVFDALLQRRSYATTGARILLEVTVNGEPMGGAVACAGPVRVRLRVHGTDVLDVVQILCGDLGRKSIRVVEEWRLGGEMDFVAEWTDPVAPESGFYYVRVAQARLYRGRRVMAWSSPVWLNLEQ